MRTLVTGRVSDCWSVGQPDVDCLNNALCCFDGCANVCQGAGEDVLFNHETFKNSIFVLRFPVSGSASESSARPACASGQPAQTTKPAAD